MSSLRKRDNTGWVWACWEFYARRLSRNQDTIQEYMESL